MAKHWHRMNGEVGCLPDSQEIYWSKKDALESTELLFEELEEGEIRELEENGIVYFEGDRKHEIGASYISIHECEDDCDMEEEC